MEAERRGRTFPDKMPNFAGRNGYLARAKTERLKIDGRMDDGVRRAMNVPPPEGGWSTPTGRKRKK